MKYLTPLISATDTYTLNAATQTLTNKTLTSPTVNGLLSGTAIASGRVTGNITVNSATLSNVSGLSFSIGVSEVWTGEIYLLITGNTNGLKFDVTGPASPTDLRVHFFGNSGGITVYSSDSVTAFSTATTVAFCATTAASQSVTIRFSINNGTNSGTIQLRAATVSGTNSSTIFLNSYLTARRIT